MKLKKLAFAALCIAILSSCEKSSVHQVEINTYPIQSDETLTYWLPLLGNSNYNIIDDINKTEFMQELRKKTGVNVEVIAPSVKKGVTLNDFDLLMASGDLPDIMAHTWYYFSGGPQKAIDDGYIINLNESIQKYAPNLRLYLNQYPEIEKQVKTQEGNYYVFPFIRESEKLTVCQGPLIRKDWLDEFNLKIPETIDEWESTLKVFKNKKNVEFPLTIGQNGTFNGAFIGAFGIIRDWFVEDGKVKLGAIDPRYKAFLITMNQWYNEGLLDGNFASNESHIIDYKITSSKTGASVGYISSDMEKWMKILKENNPNAQIVAAPYPVLNKGDRVKFTYKDDLYTTTNSVAITSKCKNVELAAQFLDYGYSDEGRTLYNFGAEGKSYTLENGKEIYTNVILKNPEGYSTSQALAQYTQVHSGPFVQDADYLEQTYSMSQQKEALNLWLDSDVMKYHFPLVAYTKEEGKELSVRIDAINDYINEMYIKFIMGIEPIENFDAYVESLYNMGIQTVIDIQQKSMERYGK